MNIDILGGGVHRLGEALQKQHDQLSEMKLARQTTLDMGEGLSTPVDDG